MYIVAIFLCIALAIPCYSSQKEEKYNKMIVYYGIFSQPLAIMEDGYRVCKEIVSLGKGRIETSVIIWLIDGTNRRYLWMHLRTGDAPQETKTFPNQGSMSHCAEKGSKKTPTPKEQPTPENLCRDFKQLLKTEHNTEEFKVKEIMLFQPQHGNLDKHNLTITRNGCMKRNPQEKEKKFWDARYCHIVNMTRKIFKNYNKALDCILAFKKGNESDEMTKMPYQLSRSTKNFSRETIITTSNSPKTTSSSSKSPNTTSNERKHENLKSTRSEQNGKETQGSSPTTKIGLIETTKQFQKSSEPPPHENTRVTQTSKLITTAFQLDKTPKSTKDVGKQGRTQKGSSTKSDLTKMTSHSQRVTESTHDNARRISRNSQEGYTKTPVTSPTTNPNSPTPKMQNETSKHTSCQQELKVITKEIQNLRKSLEKKKSSTSGWVYFVIGLFTSFVTFLGIFLIWYMTCRQRSDVGLKDRSTALSGEQEAIIADISQSRGLLYSRAGDNNITKEVSESQADTKPRLTKNMVGGKKKKNSEKETIAKLKARKDHSSRSISSADHTTKTATFKSVGPSIAIH